MDQPPRQREREGYDSRAQCANPRHPQRVDPSIRRVLQARASANGETAMAKTDLKAQFDQAAKDVHKLSERPDNDTMLKLYGLYKQGSEGDVKGEKPGFFDFVGAAKYDAWSKLKGTSQADAQKKYVDLVKKLGA